MGPRIFLISDLHFNHINILKYEECRLKAVWNRYYKDNINYEDFKTNFDIEYKNKNEAYLKEIIKKHDEMLIENWNNTVSKHDVVWFLGDLGLKDREYLASCVSRLKGNKKMITGNHDTYTDEWYKKAGFSYVSKYPIIINFGNSKFLLSHAPIAESSNLINIYGHLHSKGDSLCVSVELIDFKPITIEEVVSGKFYINGTELLNKEIYFNDGRYGIVKDLRKEDDVLLIHYFDFTNGYDEIEPLSNYKKTFCIKN